MSFDARQLVRLFADTFADDFRTRLVPGGEEPEYRPAMTPDGWHEIIFRHDYFQSALHEVAHWCVAGSARRQLHDYGYWYDPDGRTAARQTDFERVEARPQAVEWLLTVACGKGFEVSLDNLGSSDPLDAESLWRAVHAEALRCLHGDLPPRAARFGARLAGHYGVAWPPAALSVPGASPFGGGGANSSV